MRRRRTRIIAVAAVCLLAAAGFGLRSVAQSGDSYPAVPADQVRISEAHRVNGVPAYAEAERTFGKLASAAATNGTAAAIQLQAAAFTKASDDAKAAKRQDPQQGNILAWESGLGWVEWQFEAPQDGLYELSLDYLPLASGYTPIIVGVQIDGKLQFEEAGHLELVRHWKDEKFPYDRNALNNEIRSPQKEIEGWKTTTLANYSASSEPLKFQLTKGVHTLRMTGSGGPVALHALSLAPAAATPAYAQYVQSKTANTGDGSDNWYAIFEAEQYTRKSHTSVQTGSASEPYVSPDPKGRIVYNVIDGSRWKNPGEWIEWTFEVPKTGFYEIDTKYFQKYPAQGKINVYRTIMIDGQVPFREMLHVPFPYNDRLTVRTIQQPNGDPYRFYLTAGKHVLRMTADSSPVEPAVLSLSRSLDDIRDIEQQIRKITGNYGEKNGNVDLNRTWELAKYDPKLPDKIQAIIDNLNSAAAYLKGLHQTKTDATTAVEIAVDTLNRMKSDLDRIPTEMKYFTDIQSSLSTWLDQLNKQGMALDFLVVRTPEAKPELKQSTLLTKIPYAVNNFFRTFYMTYDLRKLNDRTALTVWVQRGRDYVDLLQEMIDQDFTPKTGIKVNVNLMPNANALILGNAAGDQPDVALGIAMDTPVDYAMRQAVADLSKFPGFNQTVQRFHPGAMRSYAYDGGVYALPEVQNFKLMFYRTDLLQQLGLQPPQTWEDVYRMLPTLQENGLSFYYPALDFTPFFYQQGAEFFTNDGMHSKLEGEAAQKAFEQWTGLFEKYYLPKEVPSFYNHFKLGDMPIGVADFNTYVQLLVAAPEIAGKWKIAPIPGNRQNDGTVARWAPQGLTGAIIMEKSERKEQAWKFLDWWTSNDVQLQYGNRIESFYGTEYRWNTANQQALAALSWPAEDLKAIQEQNRWTKNMPLAPGYYFLSREMEFAWIRTVVKGVPARESLEEATVSMEREMQRKQRNLNIPATADLRLPAFDQPYDWRSAQP
ncbi:extracellular solute-binding protein [Paenibacillus sp. HJGM_3]|uniref:extracellular solute-binding protein n=1 Tax=Paenibacillus sp. HJGM_3 TaxID=3379816 RepID=UPI00385DE084